MPSAGAKDGPPVNSVDLEAPPKIQVAQAIELFKRGNNPPRLFRRGNTTARVQPRKDEPAEIEQLNADGIFAEVVNAVDFVRVGKKETTYCYPPDNLMRAIRGQAGLPLPPLEGLRCAPFFTPEGELVGVSGYHAGSHIYLAPDSSLDGIGQVPTAPNEAAVKRAKELLRYPIRQFPFATSASYAATIALGLLPFMREMIDGPLPIFVVKAPAERTGKGLLIQTDCYPGLGQSIAAMPELTKGEELRKRVFAIALSGEPIVFFDNITTAVEGGALAAILTAPRFTDRILGRSEMVTCAVRCAWVLAANNPRFSHELLLRTLPIELDANMEQPGERIFDDPKDPVAYARAHRTDLVWASLVLIQNWIALARPKAMLPARLGGFDSFAAIMGGILGAAEIPGFLTNLDTFQTDAGTDADRWRPLVTQWWREHHAGGVSPTELLGVADKIDFAFPLRKGESERARVTRFGLAVARLVDRVFDICPDNQTERRLSVKVVRAEYGREGGRTNKGYALKPSEQVSGEASHAPEAPEASEAQAAGEDIF